MAESNSKTAENFLTETNPSKSPVTIKCTIKDDRKNMLEDSKESTENQDSKVSNCKSNADDSKESNDRDSKESEDSGKKEDVVCIKNEEDSLSCSKEETIANELPSNNTELNGIKNNQESTSSDVKQSNAVDSAQTFISEEEEKLKEILKVVHQDLDVKDFQKSTKHLVPKESVTNVANKLDQEASKSTDVAEKEKNNLIEDVAKESTESTEIVECSVVDETSEKIDEEKSEVGIVGPPTAISELVNEEELRAESALSTEEKVQDHVAEWVENATKTETLSSEGIRQESQDDKGNSRRKNLREKKTKKKKAEEFLHVPARKSQRIVSNIIKRSIKCLNKMHAMEGAGGNGKKVDSAEKSREEETSRASPKVPQNQQNGAALPEETAAATTNAERLRTSSIKTEPLRSEAEPEVTVKSLGSAETTPRKTSPPRNSKSENSGESGRKRKSTDGQPSANGNSPPKKICLEQREQFISSLVGCDKVSADELAARADQLRAEVQALDELARAKEMEWNEILSMRKLKEEAYLRIERRRQVMGFMEGNGQLMDTLPPATLALAADWEGSDTGSNAISAGKEKCDYAAKDELGEEGFQETVTFKKEKSSKPSSQRQSSSPKQAGENGRKQAEAQSPENRQIGEGRQGTIVDVRSIIADYRLRHPETVPRRGRRMRNSVNVGLGAGGAMVEAHNVDSRPSSTDSCKSNPNAGESNNSMSFKDVLVQFAKLSQQQGEPVKTPQNYPDVTLHPVAPTSAPQNSSNQQSGSLLHGILTKSQSPRPTTFSPTLARLLTAPERERSGPNVSMPQQTVATHLLQAYQGSNPVSISDLLSSSKARTEITITPVVNTPVQSHSNNLIHVEDVEEETSVIDERETRISSGGRESREDRDSPPRCQGCHDRAAQFVCAGCGNQWYCSRECQVAAWDEHSEVCSG